MRSSLASKVLQTIKTVLRSGSRNPTALCLRKYPIEYNLSSSSNWKTQRVAFLTPDAFAPRMFTAGMARVATQLSAVLGNPSTVPHRTGRRLLLQGVLSQPSNLNLDAWKQSAGVFPRRLNIVLRSSGCDTLQHARETFKTSFELIDRPKTDTTPRHSSWRDQNFRP